MISIILVPGEASAIVDNVNEDSTLSTIQEAKEDNANQKYNLLLKEWSRDKEYVDDAYADFPSFYGGAYIDSNKNLVILLTEINKNNIKYFGELIELTDVVFEEAKYSYTELVKEKDAATEQMMLRREEYNDVVVGVGVSIPDNMVNLYIITDNVAKKNLDVEDIRDGLSSFPNVKIVSVKGKAQTLATASPGDQITCSGGNRTVGFWAYDINSNLGIITAPHESIDQNDLISIGGSAFGRASTPYFSGGVDAVFIKQASTSSHTPTRTIPGFGTSHASGTYLNLAVGSTVYSRGMVSGCRTGVVEDTNFSVTYDTGVFTNLVLMTNYSQGGDSGGIVVGGGNSSTRYVTGIISGGLTEDYGTVYCKASLLLPRLNCRVY